ncbi:MAG: hypothetical protein ACLPY2_05245, partial [Bryobacteraceae bacterium]
RDATRAPIQARNGWRPSGRLLVSPLHHLRTGKILSKRWGPPHRNAPKNSAIVLRGISNWLEIRFLSWKELDIKAASKSRDPRASIRKLDRWLAEFSSLKNTPSYTLRRIFGATSLNSTKSLSL